MSELIDRRLAIKAIDDMPNCYDGYSDMYDKACIIGVLEELPPVSPWHRVEESPRDGQECIVAYSGPTDWIYEHATYHSDLNKALEEDIFIAGTDGFIVGGYVGYARHGLFNYWMPIEPPKGVE